MKTKILFFLIFSFSILSAAQAQTKFDRLFWRTKAAEYFLTNSITELTGGGYAIAGTVKDTSLGSLTDVFLAKFTAGGDTVWTRRITAIGSETVNDLRQTFDGGYIITGSTDSYGPGMLLMKTDSLGNVSWTKVFGSSYDDIGYSVRQNADSGFIIAGTTTLHSLIIRTNSIGDTLWTKTYALASGNDCKASCAEETPTGEFIVSAGVDSGFVGSPFTLVMKLSSNGIPIWSKKVGTGNGSLINYDLLQTLDGGYMITTQYSSGGQNPILLKFDSVGNYQFVVDITPTTSSFYFLMMAVKQLADSSYILMSSSGNLFITRISPTGDTLSTMKIDSFDLKGHGVFTSDGGFAAVDYWGGIYKFDSTFSSECKSPAQASGLLYNDLCTPSFPVVGSGTTIINATFTNMAGVIRKLYSPCMPNVPTCVVTVDSATQKNLVVWEENFDTTFVDSYQVYKESAAAGVYNLIGSVPQNQLSVFLDTACNPAVQAERYRVSAQWHTYYEPPNTVAGHKTIHLSISPGLPPTMNLSWSSYEGFTYPTYNIWRGNGTSASIIGSVPFGTNGYTDLNPPAGDTVYFIEVVHGTCTPTYFQFDPDGGTQGFLPLTQFTGTTSNMVNNTTQSVGITEAEKSGSIFLSPNPVTNKLTIESSKLKAQSAEVYDVMGQCVLKYELQISNAKAIDIDVSKLNQGIYFLKLKTPKEERVGKFIKE